VQKGVCVDAISALRREFLQLHTAAAGGSGGGGPIVEINRVAEMREGASMKEVLKSPLSPRPSKCRPSAPGLASAHPRPPFELGSPMPSPPTAWLERPQSGVGSTPPPAKGASKVTAVAASPPLAMVRKPCWSGIVTQVSPASCSSARPKATSLASVVQSTPSAALTDRLSDLSPPSSAGASSPFAEPNSPPRSIDAAADARAGDNIVHVNSGSALCAPHAAG
jgi:hypothetical protein